MSAYPYFFLVIVECNKIDYRVVKPFKTDDVREVLSDLGVTGMTLTEVKGFGRQEGIPRYIVEQSMSSISYQNPN